MEGVKEILVKGQNDKEEATQGEIAAKAWPKLLSSYKHMFEDNKRTPSMLKASVL